MYVRTQLKAICPHGDYRPRGIITIIINPPPPPSIKYTKAPNINTIHCQIYCKIQTTVMYEIHVQ